MTIDEARETGRSVTESKFKQSALTIALSNPVVNAVQTAQQMSRAASNTDKHPHESAGRHQHGAERLQRP